MRQKSDEWRLPRVPEGKVVVIQGGGVFGRPDTSPPLLESERIVNMQRLVRLCRDSFVRQYGDIGYICNQLTKHDRVYDDSGGVFLSAIRRVSRTCDDIVAELAQRFGLSDLTELRNDFAEFLSSLESDLFVVTGDTREELNRNEPRFRYGSDLVNFKEVTRSFWNPESEPWLRDSQTVLQEQFSVSPTLVDLQIELTSKCNERCRHCYLPASREMRTLNATLVDRVLNEFRENGGISITFSGGEPLLHPELPTFLQKARQHDLSIALLSNLTLLTDPIVSVLREVNVSLVQVSVYSINPDEHDRITGLPGSLAQTLSSIEKLMTANVPVQVSCPVMMTNYGSFPDVLRWANDRGLKAYTDYIMMARTDHSTDNLTERLGEPELKQLLTDIVHHDTDYQEVVDDYARKVGNKEPPQRDSTKQVCGVGRSTLCLSAAGEYYPCSGWQGISVGNAFSTHLHDVWEHSPQLKRLRSVTWASFPDCLSCDDFDYCAMCMARNHNESEGDMFKINKHYCMAAQMNKSIVDQHNAEKASQRKTANK